MNIDLEAACEPEAMFAALASMERMGEWVDLVQSVEPAEPRPDDVGPAWIAALGAKIGPFLRTMDLRFVETVRDAPGDDGVWAVRFEGAPGGKPTNHPFVMEHRITGTADGCLARTLLRFDNVLNIPFVDRFLGGEIRKTQRRILAMVEDG